jgi:hypothetical protein
MLASVNRSRILAVRRDANGSVVGALDADRQTAGDALSLERAPR